MRIFDFNNHDQIPIECGVRKVEWQRRKSAVDKLLIAKRVRKEGYDTYVDIYAELTLEEFIKSKKDIGYSVLYKWVIVGGPGIPLIVPLFAYDKNENLDNYVKGMFMVSTRFECGLIEGKHEALFDTGASVTHITHSLWIDSGMAGQFLWHNKDLCSSVGLNKVNDIGVIRDMEAERRGEDSFLLPLKPFKSGVGDGRLRNTYQFRMDKFVIENENLGGSTPVVLENIDVRIIESSQHMMILGENIINYLTTQMGPIGDDFKLIIDFTENGKRLLDKHRITKNINGMTSMYLMEEQEITLSKSFNRKIDDVKQS